MPGKIAFNPKFIRPNGYDDTLRQPLLLSDGTSVLSRVMPGSISRGQTDIFRCSSLTVGIENFAMFQQSLYR